MQAIEVRDRQAVLDRLQWVREVNYGSWLRGRTAFQNGLVEVLTVEQGRFSFLVSDRFSDFRPVLDFSNPAQPGHACTCRSYLKCCHHVAAGLMHLERHGVETLPPPPAPAGAYSRADMLQRVLEERREKARTEKFLLQAGPNIYGPHQVVTGKSKRYEITIRDYERMQGYCSCPDFKLNKLGTCKHLMFAHARLLPSFRSAPASAKAVYPYFEVFCDPLQDYQIDCYFKGMENGPDLAEALFHGRRPLPEDAYGQFLQDLARLQERRDVVIRPEVNERVEEHFERRLLERLEAEQTLDLSRLRADLYDYQRDGIRFAVFRKGAVIADDMGLGKTLQAIGAACLKREIFDFRRALVVCPASLKYQWKNEIEKFTGERAEVVEGPRENRRRWYEAEEPFFLIVNYETVLRDATLLAGRPPDLVILDEAQRIKNYETKTADAVKSIPRKHALVITGTPLENKLIDLYSIMGFVEPKLLSPLWEFSLNYCVLDRDRKNRVTAYTNLQALKDRLRDVVIRREKRDVLSQLPPIREVFVPVALSAEQAEMHAGYAKSISRLLHKKHLTVADIQLLQKLLLLMRMTCDSTYLVDGETNFSPKLEELEAILTEKLDLPNNRRKVLIFSEWKDMLMLASHRLARLNLGHVTLTGEVPSEKRGALIQEFEDNPDCRVFLSTEAGGAGLNLQVADTVINFDLPWNPAKKNQRIGRIDRLGQKAESLLVVNLVALNSIETRIADGIGLKQELFDAVLKEGVDTDGVDFAARGKSTFFSQMKEMLAEFERFSAEGGAPEEPSTASGGATGEPDREPSEDEDLLGPEDRRSAADEPFGLLDGVEALQVPEGRAEETLTDSSVQGPGEPAVRSGAEAKAPEELEASLVEESPRVERDSPPPTDREARIPQAERHPLSPSEKPADPASPRPAATPEMLEQTLNQGLAFLSGILQMATGQTLGMERQSIEVDRATGEVTMKFRLPGFGG